MGQVSLEARVGLLMRIVGLLLLGFFGAAGSASAAPVTWNGGGNPDFNWMNAANWAGNLAPMPGTDDLHFAGSVGPVSTNNFAAGSQFGGITFDAGAAPFTLGGNPINLAGDLVNNSSNLQTVNLPLNIIGNRNINAGTAGLNLAGLSGGSGAGQVITLLGTGGAIAGPISGTALLQQNASTGGSDSDTWSFLGNNTSNFAGQFVLSRGITNFGSATDAPNVKITAPASIAAGTQFFTIGNSSASGASSTFNMRGGTLTLDGARASNARIALGNNANTGNQAVWNQTGGTVTLLGISSSGGGVFLANNTGSSAQFNISGGTFDTGSATLYVAAFGNGQVNISGTSVLTVNALDLHSNVTGGTAIVNLNGGTLRLGVGAILGAQGTGGAAILNFNGGTLLVNDSQGILPHTEIDPDIVANVQAGGAIVDTSIATLTISVPLLHDPALGATLDGGLIKNGIGTLVLGNSLASSPLYDGPTSINAGTLQISNSGQLGTGPVINNAALKISGGTLPNAISGAGSLTVKGSNASSIVTLAGANTYSGPTQVQVGILNVTGSLSISGTVNLNATANTSTTLAGTGDGATTGIMGNVIMPAGTKLRPGDTGADGQIGALRMTSLSANAIDMRFDFATASNNDKIIVTGTANFSGNSVISLSSPPPAGTYVLLSAGSLNGTAPTLVGPAPGTTRADPVVEFNTAANQIRLVIAATAKTISWTSASSTAWDLHATQNWSDDGGLTTNERFFDGDSVVFDDTAPNRNVTLNSTLHPSSVTINNSLGHDYTISGTGGIADTGYTLPTFLIKKGTGEVTLGGKNQYTGSTIVEEGTFAVGSAPTGAPTLKGSMQLGTAVSSAVLDLNGLNLGVNGGIGSGGGDAGSIIGNSSTTSSSILTINAGAPATFAGTIQDSINGGTRTVGLTIGGTWTLTGNNTYSGGTPIFGTLQLGNGGTTGMIPLSGVRVNNNLGTLIFDHSDPITLTSPIAGTGTLRQSGSGVLTILYDSTLQYHRVSAGSTLQVGNGGTTGNFVSSQGTYGPDDGGLLIFNRSDGTLANPIVVGGYASGYGTIRKLGAGVVRIVGNFFGTLEIPEGTLQLASYFYLISGNISVSGGTLDLMGAHITLSHSASGKVSTIQGGGAGGVGALINTGPPALVEFVPIFPFDSGLVGDTTIGGPGQIILNNLILLVPGKLTKIGTGQLSLRNPMAGTLTGVDLREGTLSIESTSLIAPNSTLNIAAGTTFNLIYATATTQIVSNGGVISATTVAGTNNTLSGSMLLNATTTFATAASAAANIVLTVNSPISGPGGLTKTTLGTGAFGGTLFLGGNNTYSGPTTIMGGTLQLTSANRISDASNLVLAGGTFHTGGFNETLNQLLLTASSTIDLGSGASLLHFANSSLNNWTGTLNIANWDGLAAGGGIDQLFVGTNGYSGLTHAQLNSIKFGSLPTGAMLLSSGEVVPNSGPPLPLPVLGDFNGDGAANANDIAALLAAFTDLPNYQISHQIADGDLLALGDIDHSGAVDNRDLGPLLNYLAVPEPQAIVLMAIGLVMFPLRRPPLGPRGPMQRRFGR